MRRPHGRRVPAFACSLVLCADIARSQAIGTVPTRDASVSGVPVVAGARAVLTGAGSVTARDHAAEVALARGGTVRICQTSAVTLSSGKAAATPGMASTKVAAPLMVALDRGAIEIKMQAVAGDILLTPDLRFAVSHNGPIDLHVRVTPSGDTCVEQRESRAPMLLLTDSFGDQTYEIYSDQHVLFEHGSLREVVDHETSPCGCPEPARSVSLAEAALGSPAPSAAVQHPFPAAESAGLAPGGDIPQAPPGDMHTQVAATLAYEGTEATASRTSATAPGNPPEEHEQRTFGQAFKRFFKRLFGGG